MMSFRSSSRPDAVDFFARQAGRIDRRAFEVLVPVGGVVDEAALDVLLPQRRAAVDAQAVEAEACRRGASTRSRNVARKSSSVSSGMPTTKKPWTISMPAFLALRDRGLDFLERLLLLQAVEDLLAAALDAEHERAAVRLRQRREEMLRTESTRPSQPHWIVILRR